MGVLSLHLQSKPQMQGRGLPPGDQGPGGQGAPMLGSGPRQAGFQRQEPVRAGPWAQGSPQTSRAKGTCPFSS